MAFIAILAAGIIVRFGLALPVPRPGSDVDSFRIVTEMLKHSWLNVYQESKVLWPYPPGYFAWMLAASKFTNLSHLPFGFWFKVPPILADIGTALVAWWYMWTNGKPRSRQLMAAGLVALGPSFFLISGQHGQIDAVAIFPAIVAAILWQRMDSPRRALICGALIGMGGAVKTVPLVMVIALLPTARSLGEAVKLLAVAAAIPILVTLPFVLSDPQPTISALRYLGIPGVGGLSLIMQPDLAQAWLLGRFNGFSPLTSLALDNESYIAGAVVLLVAGLLYRKRMPAIESAVVVWLAIYAFVPNFFFQYLVWGLPFFILANHVGKVLLLELALVLPTVLAEFRLWSDDRVLVPYISIMVLVWVAFVIAFFRAGILPPGRVRGAVSEVETKVGYVGTT